MSVAICRDSLLLLIQSMNALFIFTVGMHLLKTVLNTAYVVFRDFGRSYWTAPGSLYQIGKSLLQVVFLSFLFFLSFSFCYKCSTAARATTKSEGDFF